MSSACTRVLSTPELLESILKHLPLPTLLHAQLVSTYFHSTITSSPILQQLLFFRPSTSQEWTLNPLLRKHFLPFFVVPGKKYGGGRHQFKSLQALPWTKSPTTKAAFLRKGASWRNMLIMHPSPKVLHVKSWVHAMGGDTESKVTISFPDNCVTMGKLYDIAESFVKTQYANHGSFGLSFIDKGPTEPPYLALQLSWGVSCTPSWAHTDVVLRSDVAEMDWNTLEWEPKPEGWHRGYRDSSYKSDLTGEMGGVESEEWESWVGEMGPLEEPVDRMPEIIFIKNADGTRRLKLKD
jgi:hypothetical protein